MIRAAAVLATVLALAGCITYAQVSVDGNKPVAYFNPIGGVTIARDDKTAVAARFASLGFWKSCYHAGFGGGFGYCAVIPPDCGLGVVEVERGAKLDSLTAVAKSVTVHCLSLSGRPK